MESGERKRNEKGRRIRGIRPSYTRNAPGLKIIEEHRIPVLIFD